MFKNIFYIAFEKIIKLFLGVFVSGVLARYLGVNEFGELNYILSILLIIVVLSTLGMNRIVVRETTNSSSEKEINILISSVFYTRIFFTVLLYLLSISLIYIYDKENIKIYIIVLSSLLLTPFDVYEFYKQGVNEFKIISLSRTVSFIISTVIRLIFVFYSKSLYYFALCIFLEYLFSSLFFLYLYNKDKIFHGLNAKYFSFEKAKELIRESWPEIIAGFGAILFMKVDLIMLYWMKGDGEVGIYTAASRLSEAWYFIPIAIVSASFPKLLELKKIDRLKYIEFLTFITSLLFYIGICASIFINLFGSFAVELIYGDNFSRSADVLIIHTWAGIFLCLGISSGSWLVAEKKLKLNLYRNIFGLIINIIGNFLLIGSFGAKGAAIAMILGMFSSYFLFDYFTKELKEIAKIKRNALSPIFLIKKLKNYNGM